VSAAEALILFVAVGPPVLITVAAVLANNPWARSPRGRRWLKVGVAVLALVYCTLAGCAVWQKQHGPVASVMMPR
jgi:hypothetical protein